MQRFHFRLAALLKYRKVQKEQAILKYNEAVAELINENDRLRNFKQMFQDNIVDFTTRQQKVISPEILKTYYRFFDRLRGEISKQNERVTKAEERCHHCRQILENTTVAYKVVDKLYEQKLLDYRAGLIASEQKILDEIGICNYKRE